MRATPIELRDFLAALPEERVGDFASLPDLPERLGEVWERVHQAWPVLTTGRLRFYPYLAQRVQSNLNEPADIDRMDAPGLYLACACIEQEPLALESFQKLLIPYAHSLTIRTGLDSGAMDDLVATLSEQMLVGSNESPPRIAQYSGRGSLRAWLKVSVTRMALRRAKKYKNEQELPEDERVLPEDQPSDDLVLAYLRRQFRAPFTEAFREAFAALSSDDRLLMRRKFVDGLTGDELAVLHKMHRATVVRRLSRARQQLVEDIRSRLVHKLQVGHDEVDSIIRVLRSQLDASFGSLLGSSDNV